MVRTFITRGFRADIVTVAKALGNGVPIGAVWATAEVAAAFKPGDHGSTFAGQPLAASGGPRGAAGPGPRSTCPSLARPTGCRTGHGAAAVGTRAWSRVRGLGLLLGGRTPTGCLSSGSDGCRCRAGLPRCWADRQRGDLYRTPAGALR